MSTEHDIPQLPLIINTFSCRDLPPSYHDLLGLKTIPSLPAIKEVPVDEPRDDPNVIRGEWVSADGLVSKPIAFYLTFPKPVDRISLGKTDANPKEKTVHKVFPTKSIANIYDVQREEVVATSNNISDECMTSTNVQPMGISKCNNVFTPVFDHNYAKTWPVVDEKGNDKMFNERFTSDMKMLQDIHGLYVMHIANMKKELETLKTVSSRNEELVRENFELVDELDKVKQAFAVLTEENLGLQGQVESLGQTIERFNRKLGTFRHQCKMQ